MSVPGAATVGVILAGGQGSRLGGRDKAWLRYRGQPLLCHAWQCLSAQVAQIVVSSQRHGWAYRRLGITAVADLDARPGRGPLAAIAGALSYRPDAWLAFMPVDVPTAPRDFVKQLQGTLRPGDRAAALLADGREQPLFALLSGSLAALAASALAGHRPPSVRAWLDSVAVRWVRAKAMPGAFMNINTAEDWRLAQIDRTGIGGGTDHD